MGKTQHPVRADRSVPEGETTRQTLERLVREQGVKPINLEEYARLWPADFDPDAFNAWLAEHRAGRRAAAAEKGE